VLKKLKDLCFFELNLALVVKVKKDPIKLADEIKGNLTKEYLNWLSRLEE
jgi:hypothetical protein